MISKSFPSKFLWKRSKNVKQTNTSRELIENALAPKHQKISSPEHTALVELLVAKDEELKKLLALAAEQEKIEETMNELRLKVDVQVSL